MCRAYLRENLQINGAKQLFLGTFVFMLESRLNDLAVLSIQSDTANSISFDGVIKTFVENRFRDLQELNVGLEWERLAQDRMIWRGSSSTRAIWPS